MEDIEIKEEFSSVFPRLDEQEIAQLTDAEDRIKFKKSLLRTLLLFLLPIFC